MNVLSEETIIKSVLRARVVISTLKASFMRMEALSIYLFSIALLLLVAVILFAIHWRHQVVQKRKKLARENLNAPEDIVAQHLYDKGQFKYYEPLQDKTPSVENLDRYGYRYSHYDNYPQSYERSYDSQPLRKTDVI